MRTLKPLVGLEWLETRKLFRLEVIAQIEVGLRPVDFAPVVKCNEPIPVTLPHGNKPDDQGPGTETLIRIAFVGTATPGAGTYSYFREFFIDPLEARDDIRVRVMYTHENQHHDGTSSAHYKDPD